jgi:hypothetical protein
MRATNYSDIHVRILTLYTDKPFNGHGSDVRRAITAKFKDIAVLHNHKENGFDYKSPRVRYLVIDNYPRLVSFADGLDIVERIYKEQPDLRIGTKSYLVSGTELQDTIETVGISDEGFYKYRSITPWIALNEENHVTYKRTQLFLIGNLLALSKNLNIEVQRMVDVKIDHFAEINLEAGSITILGFKVEFKTNFKIPQFIGVGKLVSKGFGVMHYAGSIK